MEVTQMYIYADNAATTKTSQAAIKAMNECMEDFYGNPSSLHSVGQRAAEKLLQARMDVAECLGADFKEIYFTSGGSEADNQAIVSAATFGAKKGKKHIISTKIEHHAVLHTLAKLEKQGFEVTLLDVNEKGEVDPKAVEDAIREDTALVSIIYANNEIGTIEPITEIGEICERKGVIFHTDAVQAVGHVDIDVKKQKIDMLSLSAHKFHGPKGVGVLYANKKVPLTNIIEGGAQERGKRAGTENLPGIVGMAVALKDAVSNIEKSSAKVTTLRDRLIEGLSKIEHSVLNGASENRLPGNVNFCFEGIEGESLLLLLDAKGIAASSGSACTSGSLDPSHVLLAIGRPHEVAHGSLRLTIAEDITEEQIDYMVKEISNILSSANISYVKWDMNRIFSDYYSAGLPYESQGEVPHRYVLGFYKMAKALTEKFPEILFEGCCGGGNRFDLGMLCYFPQIWASDDTDAVCRVNIQNGYSYGYPMSTVGAHVSACPNHQTLRTTPIDTRYNVACFGVLGYECDLTKMSKEDLFLIKKQIEEYKKWRKVLQFGEFYRGKSPYENSQDSDSNNVYQWTCVSADKKKAVGMLFRKIIKPNDQFLNFRPKALAENKEYHFYNRPVYHNKKDMGHFVYENNEIKSDENLSKDEVLFVAENFVKGETEDYIAYGSLLNEAGVNLKEGFAGIGVNGDTRIMKDFDSRLYYMEEVE